ncbi:methyl- binding domain isoform X2 [Labeo rohita]|nr:methyl- binding domain isoform X2 [Labeo rohita]
MPGTATPVPEPTRTPEVLPRTTQSIFRNLTSTSQRPRLIPISSGGGSSLSRTHSNEFHSPPRVTRVSPLSIDTSVTRNFVHSPVVKVGNVSEQAVSATGSGKNGSEPPLRLWLCPSLEPISPTKTQDTFSDQTAAKKRNRRMCRQCVACLREDDCGKCDFCMDKPKFGGSNKKRQKCRLRQCKFQSKLHGQRTNDPDILGSERSVMVSNEMYSNTSGLSAQGLYYNMSGMPAAPHVLGSVPLCNSNPVPTGELVGSLPMGDDATQNGFLQIEMVRVGSPLSHYTEEPQNTEQHMPEPQQEPTPVITQIFSLAGGENDCDRDQGLMELFTSLGQTVLPAHWVGVMAKGPVLQLLQCSKLSTMADTVVQIEKGFFYQVSVQNQPLLLMHALYSRHPTCLETVGDVVSLLLDLEGLGVCQGYQNFDAGSPWEPRMSVRAALCDLLVPKDEEQCPKCTQPVEG